MKNSELSEKQKEVLHHKEGIHKAAKKALSMIATDTFDYSKDLKPLIFDINYHLGCIATIVGGKMSDKLRERMKGLQKYVITLEAMDSIFQQQFVNMWLMVVDGMVVKFEEGRPIKVELDIDPLTAKFKGLFSRGND